MRLDVIKRLFKQLDDPQDRIPVIHVAGTNGKGSVCAYLGAVLRAAGYKTGVFTSPHLLRVNERVNIDGADIADEIFAEASARVEAARKAANIAELHFFEYYTAVAYDCFARNNVGFAVMETGIGGRLDPTNVVKNPVLSVITAMGTDHTAMLGSTPEAIAREKAGIIKEGCPVAVYPGENSYIFRETAERLNAPFYYIGDNADVYGAELNLSGSIFSIKTEYFAYQTLNIQLLGLHQINNAAHALLCVKALTDGGYKIPKTAVYEGLADARLPGRFEIIDDSPVTVLDGAHNESGAECFNQSTRYYFNEKKIVLIAGALKTKDVKSIMRELTRGVDTVFCVQPSNLDAAPAEMLAEHVKNARVCIEPDVKTAYGRARAAAGVGGVVAIAGSLYLAADILRMRKKGMA